MMKEHSLRSKDSKRYLNPKYNDLQYHKTLLDEVIELKCLDYMIDDLEVRKDAEEVGQISKIVKLKNKINEVR